MAPLSTSECPNGVPHTGRGPLRLRSLEGTHEVRQQAASNERTADRAR